MNLKCAICESSSDVEIFHVKEMYVGIRDIHDYFQCPECGCLQIVRVPENIQKYYEGSYYSYQTIDRGGSLAQRAFVLRNEFALRGRGLLGRLLFALKPTSEFDFLRPLLGNVNASTRFLDVGCGSGTLLRSLYDLGFHQLKGIDPFIEKNILVANNFLIEKICIEEELGEFDVLMMHHSLEHMPDQFAALKAANRLVADDGMCIVRIPISSSHAWEHYRENWAQLDAPRHFYLHSIDSLKRLANQCGFSVVDILHDSSAFQMWGSEQYKKNIALQEPSSYFVNKKSSIFSKREIKNFEKRAKELNAAGRGDQAIFFLKKRER